MRVADRLHRAGALIGTAFFLAFMLSPLAAWPVAAQVGTGAIVGQVSDESGAVLPASP